MRSRWCRGALVKGHHNVGTDDALGVDHVFGSEEVLAAVDVGAEADALPGELADTSEGEDLEASGVGEDGLFPTIEAVQASDPAQDVKTRAEVEMIGVAEDDLGADVVAQLALVHCLDTAHGTHGHEDGRLHLAMSGGETSGTRRCALGGGFYAEFHALHFGNAKLRNFLNL